MEILSFGKDGYSEKQDVTNKVSLALWQRVKTENGSCGKRTPKEAHLFCPTVIEDIQGQKGTMR
jgi:hypothetical protein